MNAPDINAIAIANAVALLEAHPDFKIVSRFQTNDVYTADDDTPKGVLMVLDTETTGLDPEVDVVFELGYVMVEYSKTTGNIHRVLDRYCGQEDPGFELSEETVKITGVNYELEVKGKTLDRPKIQADIARTTLVLAHNAEFDRKMVEKIFPEFEKKPWMCSFVQGPWKEMGFGSSKLDYLLVMAANKFHEAHRALVDCEALLHLLATPGPDNRSVFSHILEKGREPSYVIWANGSGFDTKDILKKNGYRWSDGSEPGKFKAWYKRGVTDPDAEIVFLQTSIYKRPETIYIDQIDAFDDFSTRTGLRDTCEIVPIKSAGLRPR